MNTRLEEIIEQFLSLTQAQFTKKRSGENDAYVDRRNIRDGWKKFFIERLTILTTQIF